MLLATFLVSTTDDVGLGSLRQAILDSNTATAGTNTIDFALPGAGIQVIAPFSALPAITNPVVIDGFSQQGSSNAPVIELNGQNAGTANGLTITGPGSTIRGLDIGGFLFGAGILVDGPGAQGNTIVDNVIGTDPVGTTPLPNGPGIQISDGVSDTTVGGTDPALGNLIADNFGSGVVVTDAGSIENRIHGNRITGNGQTGLNFDGAGSHVVVPDDPGLEFSAGQSFTLSASVDVTSLPNHWRGIATKSRDAWPWYGLWISDTNQWVAGGPINIYGPQVTIGRHEVAMVQDAAAGTRTLYVDGTAVAEGPAQDGNGGGNLWIGGADAGEFFQGEVSSVAVWSVARSADQIDSDLTATLTGQEPGLQALYRFNEGSGLIVHDLTPNHHDGNFATALGSAPPVWTSSELAIDLGGDGATGNGPSPRQGPNDLQNFPVIVRTAAGDLQGWLGGSLPNTSYEIDVFAGAAFSSGGSVQPEDRLGSIQVTTDATGQAQFAVPFTPPADLPVITATATDPLGNTSELSAARQGVFQTPVQAVSLVPGSPLVLSLATSDSVVLEDPGAGPLDPVWDLNLSVPDGTLTLAETAGLTGTGNGTGSLSYRGPLSALDTALARVTYVATTPPGSSGDTAIRLEASSAGAATAEGRVIITDGAFVVTTTADSGPGSLRQAILDSDAATAARSTIDFDIAGPGVHTITPLSPLPFITNPVTIDGFSQPGFRGTPLIEIDGNQANSFDGLLLVSPDNTIRGLDIGFFQDSAIEIAGPAATGNWIYGNFLGTDPTGRQAEPNLIGIFMSSGAGDNLIGTNGDGVDDAAERNVISGNGFAGVQIAGPTGDQGNVVAGNFIGTDVTGRHALPNGVAPRSSSFDTIGGGIVLLNGAVGNRIGTDGATAVAGDERNVIAGNDNDGIDLIGSNTTGNIIAGNFIGTDVTGRNPLGNQGDGVFIAEGASSNWIGVNPQGGPVLAEEGNVIGANRAAGVEILSENANAFSGDDFESDDNVVAGNFIGTDATGTAFLPNGFAGIGIDGGSRGNTIGGTSAFAGNLITNNFGFGVGVTGTLTVENSLIANRIFGNSGQAIDLGEDGVTHNSAFARQGPNDLRNAPVIVTTADGRLQGVLSGSTPETRFRIDVFASVGYGPGGAGEAEDDLGSLEVTTDRNGQAVFDVPFTAPPGLPLVTATATDPRGNTSEVSGLRQGAVQTSEPTLHWTPGGTPVFSVAAGDGIAVRDLEAGSLDLTWGLNLSVPLGTLTLSGTAGLTGFGDGTGTLFYVGPLSALNAALDGLHYTPPPGFHGSTVLFVGAESEGAIPFQTQVPLSDGLFVVTSAADSGPGSLRQAILDSNAIAGGTNTIDFAIPGAGVETIALNSPLPPITEPVLIDGSSQPGYAGTPLIALGTQSIGSPDGLTVTGSSLRLDGVAAGGFGLGTSPASNVLDLQSDTLRPGPNGAVDQYRIDTSEDGLMIARVHATGLATRMRLLDSQGRVLVESDGLSHSDPDDLIDQHLPAGTYFLEVESTSGQGFYTLKAMLTPASTPFQPFGAPASPNDVSSLDSYQVATGDFNADGIPDVVSPNGVQLGVGDGTFRSAASAPVLPEPSFVYLTLVIGDFNGDGKLDIAVADFIELDVLLGNGDGTFQPPLQYATRNQVSSMVAGDFNGDGMLDLALAEASGGAADPSGVVVFLGNGDGTLQPPTKYASAETEILNMVGGDFNRDGRSDLAFTGLADQIGGGGIRLMLGRPDGTFQILGPYAVGTDFAGTMASADLNGDGTLDLVFNAGDNVMLGRGDGTFQAPLQETVGDGSAVVTGDFNGDGAVDIADMDQGGNIAIRLGNGDGTFQPPRENPVADAPTGIVYHNMAVADLNGDGRLDLVFAGNVGGTVEGFAGLTLLEGNGDGTFETGQSNVTGLRPDSLVEGDFNNDGRIDLVVANAGSNDFSVLLGNGDGTYQPAKDDVLGPIFDSFPAQLVSGDFNGDGRLDLAVLDFAGFFKILVLLGNGDGTFQPQQIVDSLGEIPGAKPRLVTGDFNGDGRLDLAATEFAGIALLTGNGDGTFRTSLEIPLPQNPFGDLGGDSLVAGDFNGDGKLDLATERTAANFLSEQVVILLGDGDGTFQPARDFDTTLDPFNAGALVGGDFDGDGKVDLATPGINEQAAAFDLAVFRGNGDGTFQPATYSSLTTSGGTDDLTTGDFNGDGKLDVAFDGFDFVISANRFSLFLGNGDGTIQATPVRSDLGIAPLSGDVNGDGKIDLAVGGSEGVSVLLGTGDGGFDDAGQVVTAPHSTPLIADVNGDGNDDVMVVNAAGAILYRQGRRQEPGTFDPPVTINPDAPSRDIAWFPGSDQGPLLASVDAQDDSVSLFAFRAGVFVRIGSVATGRLPAQLIATDLNHDGWDDLVVRNAGDGTLSVFFNTGGGGGTPFLPPTTVPVGLGVSDVAAVDPNGAHVPDLVVTNKLTGQVSVLHNQGNHRFASPVPYRAGAGTSGIDAGSGTPQVASLEGTAAVAAGSSVDGSTTELITMNSGSNTLDVLAALGGGRYANPVAIQTPSAGQAVSVADFNHDGIPDIAFLGTSGIRIELGDPQGGFAPAASDDSSPGSNGLTVADVNHDGNLDLVVGDPAGDVLVLLGQGDGTFQPFQKTDRSIALAVADLAGNGSKDFIYADQGLDRVVVSDGSGGSTVLGDQSQGVLNPGAVTLADLDGDGKPDLIVANSGGNDVLIYPGLGNGQFGPAINGGHGYFTGTDPVGITLANLTGNLPDLVIANKGSNDVSILFNQSTSGNISLRVGPRLSSGGTGPVSTVVQAVKGGNPNLLVSNSESNTVALLPGRGQGFFDDVNPVTFPVGNTPGSLFVGNFNGQTGLVTVNAGSNDLTLIAGFEGPAPIFSTIASGGLNPLAAVAFDSGNGFLDLVVGNAGDGELALFQGGPDGLIMTLEQTEPNLPDPTDLAFSALTGGEVELYAATAGAESAELVALSLGIATAPSGLPAAGGGAAELLGPSLGPETAPGASPIGSPTASPLVQLVPLTESSLPLIATVLTLTILVPGDGLDLGLAETESVGVTVAAFLPGTVTSVGQGLSARGQDELGANEGPLSDQPDAVVPGAGAVPAAIASWERFVIGLDEALEQFRAENPDGVAELPAQGAARDRPEPPPAPVVDTPSQDGPLSSRSSPNPIPGGSASDPTEQPSVEPEAIDAVVEAFWGDERPVIAQSPPPIALDWVLRDPKLSPESAPSLDASDRQSVETLWTGPDTDADKDEPDLASTSLAVAAMTAWVPVCNSHRTVWPVRRGQPVRHRRLLIK